MADRYTSVRLRTQHWGRGFAELGRHSRAEMIKQLRENALRDLEVAQQILAADDEDFEVLTYVGAIVMRDRKEVLD